MPRGSRPGERRGGRRRGTPNKRTLEGLRAAQEAAKKIEQVIDGSFKGDGHALLMAIYKDPGYPLHVRIDAAKAAIVYERPRLAAIHVPVDQEVQTSSVEQDAEYVLRKIERYLDATTPK